MSVWNFPSERERPGSHRHRHFRQQQTDCRACAQRCELQERVRLKARRAPCHPVYVVHLCALSVPSEPGSCAAQGPHSVLLVQAQGPGRKTRTLQALQATSATWLLLASAGTLRL